MPTFSKTHAYILKYETCINNVEFIALESSYFRSTGLRFFTIYLNVLQTRFRFSGFRD
jgi:hypothetical protein